MGRRARLLSDLPLPRTADVAACPLCGSSRHVFRFEQPDRAMGVPGCYRYRECASCGTVFQSPRVVEADLPLLYPQAYYTHEAPSLESGARGTGLRGLRDAVAEGVRNAVLEDAGRPGAVGRLLAHSRRMRERAFRDRALDELVPRRRQPGRLLDVGCGTGLHMRLLADLGWEVEGLEWDARAADVARSTTGRPVSVGDVHTLGGRGRFDAILLHHVFEHLVDPVGTLRRLGELIVPGGSIVLVWPNPRALGARRFGGSWFAWDPPRHLVLPPVSAVAAAAVGVGLRVRSWRTLTRGAAAYAAHSRAIEVGGGVTEDPAIRTGDRVFQRVESGLTWLDREAGEEGVLVLSAGDPPATAGSRTDNVPRSPG